MDQQRFIRHLGRISAETMEEITLAIATVIEYP
jgi:mRNA-degrading endonuclease toxin of MazEF toxin-antitoxin module